MAAHRLLLILLCGRIICSVVGEQKITSVLQKRTKQQTTEQEIFAQALTKFTLNLNRRLYNIYPEADYGAFSPFDLYLQLFLLYSAANGVTRSVLLQVMNLSTNLSINNLSDEFSDTLFQIVEERKNGMFEFANGIFLQSGFPIKYQYQSLVQNKYITTVDSVNFGNLKSSSDVINAWVSKTTDGRINYFSENLISKDTMMLAVNAMYVSAIWRETYGIYKSFWGNFYVERDTVVQVEYISNIADIRYYSNKIFTAIGLPLANDLVAYYLLPNNKISLQKMINRLNSNYLKEMLETEINQRINFTIPKHKIDVEIDFREVLSELGAAHIFNKYANFSNLSEGISLSDITQKICYNADETGAWERGKRANYKNVSNSVTIDRPYMLMIYHQTRQYILLSLTIKNPSTLVGIHDYNDRNSDIGLNNPDDVNHYNNRYGYVTSNNRPNYINLGENTVNRPNRYIVPNNRPNQINPISSDENRFNDRNSYGIPNNRPNYINLGENTVNSPNRHIFPNNRPNQINPIGLDESRVNNRNRYNRYGYIVPENVSDYNVPNSAAENRDHYLIPINRHNYINSKKQNTDGIKNSDSPINFIIPESRYDYKKPQLDKRPELFKNIPILLQI